MSDNKFKNKNHVISYLENVAEYGLLKLANQAKSERQKVVTNANYELMFDAIKWIEEHTSDKEVAEW